MYYLFVTLLILYLSSSGTHAEVWERASDCPDGLDSDPNSVRYRNTYDFIVVGVGQAGSVAAARLAANGRFKVLGIEAGERSHRSLNGTDYVTSSFSQGPNGQILLNTPFTRFDVPTFFPSTYVQPTPYTNWQVIRSGVVQTGFVAKILGGSGAHNGMLWSRMTKQNVDSWGVSKWSWNDVLPFYKKTENVTGSRAAINPGYHGFSGPVQITDVPTGQFYEAVDPWIKACVATGVPYNPDFNGPNRLGCGTNQFNIRRGVRDSTANAFLPKAIAGGNLALALGAQANKILFERQGYDIRAVGIEYVQNGVTKRAYARKEIVLSLSAILTPKLLQLSGIGPAALLRRFNIPVVVDNVNVGRNLSNNQVFGGAFEYPNAVQPNGWRISDYTQQYALYGTGPLSFPAFFASAYVCSKKPSCDNPDVLVGTSAGIYFGETKVPILSFDVESAFPESIGNVTISSADPDAPPHVDEPLFNNEADLNATIYGIRFMRQVMSTYPANVTFGKEIIPGPSVNTYQELSAYVKKNGIPNAHYSGTARVGNVGDKGAVVDPQLRVNGVKGLRIGDTSICHRTPSHTQASAAMVGERVAQFILDEYN